MPDVPGEREVYDRRAMSPDDWRARGKTLSVPEGRVFVVELGDPDGTPVLVLHGFPTSSHDFAEAAAIVAEKRRVILFDFLGFGFSDKPADMGYSLFEQADVALAVARDRNVARADLWAHDMGTSVATELLARRERGLLPFAIERLVLMNGSVHVDLAHLTPGQRLLQSPAGAAFARLAGRRTFGLQMKRIFARAPDEATLDAMWALVARADGALRMPQIIRYLEERARFARRWIGALERLDVPTLIAWGTRDPVAVPAIAEQLAREIPNAQSIRWEDLGHYPQIEDPARVAGDVLRFFDRANDISR